MSEIQQTFGPLTVDSVQPHQFKDGIQSAQLRQTVVTIYPSMRVGNSEADLLFSEKEFNLADGQTYESIRVTWVNVPSDATVETVTQRLAGNPNARIFRKISYNVMDVLTDEQRVAISQGLRTKEEFEDSLLVRDREGNNLPGQPQYRQNFFAATAKADQDFRANVAAPTAIEEQQSTTVETEASAPVTKEPVVI